MSPACAGIEVLGGVAAFVVAFRRAEQPAPWSALGVRSRIACPFGPESAWIDKPGDASSSLARSIGDRSLNWWLTRAKDRTPAEALEMPDCNGAPTNRRTEMIAVRIATKEPPPPPPPPKPPDRIVIDMSEDEALTLALICFRIGGSPYTTRRKHTATLLSALTSAGVRLPLAGILENPFEPVTSPFGARPHLSFKEGTL